jgi:SAM-dependent methyltransferase
MMAVPETVRTALADQPVAGRACLEAGSGVGNMTAALRAAGAADIYAITDDRSHARAVRDRIPSERVHVLRADLRSIPLPGDAVEFVTAHALFNVVPPSDADVIASALSCVASPGARLVVDDYTPVPDAEIRELFAVENAAAELATGRPALTFYPAAHLRALFEAHGWTFERRRSLLDPVPWTESHVEAHLDVVYGHADALPDAVARALVDRAERLAADIGTARAGEMYSLAFTRD